MQELENFLFFISIIGGLIIAFCVFLYYKSKD